MNDLFHDWNGGGCPGALGAAVVLDELADRIYSGVPAGEFGKEQQIEIGPMSGLSDVNHWLLRHEIPADEPLAKAVLQRAKAANRTLTESEVAQIVRDLRSEARS